VSPALSCRVWAQLPDPDIPLNGDVEKRGPQQKSAVSMSVDNRVLEGREIDLNPGAIWTQPSLQLKQLPRILNYRSQQISPFLKPVGIRFLILATAET
jgi:hypothetical protein